MTREEIIKKWATYLHRYFGDVINIYDSNGKILYGEGGNRDVTDLRYRDTTIYRINSDIGEIALFVDTLRLISKELEIFKTIHPFIESNIEMEIEGL